MKEVKDFAVRAALAVLDRFAEPADLGLFNGELLRIGLHWYRVNGLDPEGRQVSLQVLGPSKASPRPWRITQWRQGTGREWQPSILDAGGRVIALVFGPDPVTRDANAQAFVAALEPPKGTARSAGVRG